MPHHISDEMRQCIRNCTECHNACVETMAHCIAMGGKHAEASHLRLLADCAQICAASADFMLRGSNLHAKVCGVCADICEACAQDCERLDPNDQTMQRCAQACRQCADSCRRMAQAA